MSCTALELRERKSNALLLFRDEPIQTFHKRIRPSSLKGRFQHGNNLRNYEDLPHTNLIILVQVLKQCFTALRSVRSVLIHRDICSFLRGVSSRFPSRLLEQRGTTNKAILKHVLQKEILNVEIRRERRPIHYHTTQTLHRHAVHPVHRVHRVHWGVHLRVGRSYP